MKKRVLALVLAGVTSASLLGGCGSAASAPASASTEAAAEDTAADTASTEAATDATDTADASADSADDPVFMEFEGAENHDYAPKWDTYDSLIDEIRKDTDLEDREAKMHEAEDMLMATGAVLPLY